MVSRIGEKNTVKAETRQALKRVCIRLCIKDLAGRQYGSRLFAKRSDTASAAAERRAPYLFSALAAGYQTASSPQPSPPEEAREIPPEPLEFDCWIRGLVELDLPFVGIN